ncbi:Ig-like domain-containing protein [Solimonas flava]|uniref:Ig-like domain-containing protein n=1 Tax=Solimonas flava TaxID=415849 RepID=UPI0004097C6C|nr:Ig-like domain-containing protein [Solimonas flava]
MSSAFHVSRHPPQRRLLSRAMAGLLIVQLAACGGGGGDDEAPPSVALTASATTVEGGETVALTATARNAQGDALEVGLACTGGTLEGTLLITPTVTVDTDIVCTATATDAAERTARAEVTIRATATLASLTIPDGKSTLAGGELGLLFADQLPLEDESYVATLDGQDLTLYRSDAGTLTFAVPATAVAGEKILRVTIGTRSYAYPLQIEGAPAIADAGAVVSAALRHFKAQLDDIVTAYGATFSASQLATIEQQQQDLDAALAQLDGATPAELEEAAVVLVANGFIAADGSIPAAATPARAFDLSACKSKTAEFVRSNASLALWMSATYWSGKQIANGSVLSAIYAGVAIGSAVNAFTEFNKTRTSVGAVLGTCLKEVAAQLVRVITGEDASRGGSAYKQVRALTGAARIGFANDVAQTFRIERTLRIDDSVLGVVQANFARLATMISRLPYLPDSLQNLLASLQTEKTEDLPAAGVTLGGISRSDISGSAAPSAVHIVLKFKAIEPEEENIDFDFKLLRDEGDPITVAAQLSIDLPEADDAAITVTQGTPAESTLSVRGADSLEVVSAPTLGSVSLQADDRFTYTPSGQSFGADRFTYRAKNENGYSKAATVLVTIKRVFEGAWEISSHTTVTSVSQPGLCEDEDSRFTVGVSKISDTKYLTEYAGKSLELTMGSADDPSGLSGQLTVTMEDGPGETTETVRVSIPNSTELSGQTSWTYRGPGETRCTGVSRFTGRRP